MIWKVGYALSHYQGLPPAGTVTVIPCRWNSYVRATQVAEKWKLPTFTSPHGLVYMQMHAILRSTSSNNMQQHEGERERGRFTNFSLISTTEKQAEHMHPGEKVLGLNNTKQHGQIQQGVHHPWTSPTLKIYHLIQYAVKQPHHTVVYDEQFL